MMGKVWLRYAMALWMFIGSMQLFAADDNDINKSYRKAAKRFRFTIRANAKFNRAIKGERVPLEEVEGELNRFFEALDTLGDGFVKKSGLKYVMICRNLQLDGMPCAGIASGNCIYLNVGFSKKTVYHEIFHIFDSKRNNKKWLKLNHKNFIYRGIDFPDRPIGKAKHNKIKRHYSKNTRDFNGDFASRYAQSNEAEDRAETFSYMIDRGPLFVQRAEKSPYLYNKMVYIIDMTDRSSLLGKAFWQKILGIDVSTLKMRKAVGE